MGLLKGALLQENFDNKKVEDKSLELGANQTHDLCHPRRVLYPWATTAARVGVKKMNSLISDFVQVCQASRPSLKFSN